MKRRDFIKFSTTAAVAYTMGHSLSSFAGRNDIGNVVVILCRGGMDGLAAIQPKERSRLQKIRKSCYINTPLKLTADFDLHPKLRDFKSHWDSQNAAAVHATGFSYFGRSHFDGQNIMELGAYKPYTMSTGWLGRAMELKNLSSLALNLPTPIIVTSSAGNANYYPSRFAMPPKAKVEAIKELWVKDPVLSGFIDETTTSTMNPDPSRNVKKLAREVARQMSLEGGPKVGFIEYSGFDTHSTQGADNGHQAKHLQKVDDIIRAFSSQSKSVWKKTVIVTVTEFGRTVRQNGSQGTDHGAASAILMAGGLIKQPKVIADWPGLKDKELHEHRDLRETIDARDVYGDILHHAFDISKAQIRDVVFPGSKQKLDLGIWG
jgi:uncharacterized protein (DUF1501 family)